MSRKHWAGVVITVAVIALIASGFGAFVLTHTPSVVTIGTPIRHDDFLFTVTAVRKTALRGGAAHYTVDVRVQNQAKVVDYQWRDAIAYVRAFDAGGYGHDFYPVTRGSFVLRADEERTAKLQFDVPAGYSSANLRFWDGIFMGDAFNGGAYGRAIVPLEPYHPPFGT